ncbi:phosphopantothenoylcysteine decarboxylase isoform X1 [Eleginops maclovinus]|uniref:phosphopantothenoylcysteine decarboxylase isoform X1 n=1 Tax=Eleginops maclovinus TaxID=56733 RepID=UPI003080A070
MTKVSSRHASPSANTRAFAICQRYDVLVHEKSVPLSSDWLVVNMYGSSNPEVVYMSQIGVDVRVVTTEHAKHFYNPAEVPVKIYDDKDEWELWTQRSDPVLHIELRRWADLLVIAPLDANTLGKIANGICDNLLTCVVRAWDTSRPLLFCPAMNTAMWQHPITAQQVSRLTEFGYVEIPCIAKKLVCGDEGKGAMAEVSTIVSVVKQYLPIPDETSQKT